MESNLIPFGPGHDPRRNLEGRPKKIHTVLKKSGYTKDDIREAFSEIGWQLEEDVDAILEDPTKPMILRLIARAFKKGTEKGDFRYVSEILQHVIGKPKEQIESLGIQKIIVEYVNPNDQPLPPPSGTEEGD